MDDLSGGPGQDKSKIEEELSHRVNGVLSVFAEPPPKIPLPVSANLDVLDVGRVLVQAISDLKLIREELGKGQQGVPTGQLNQLLTVTEDELRKKTESMLSASADGGMITYDRTGSLLLGGARLNLSPLGDKRSIHNSRQNRRNKRAGDVMRTKRARNLLANPGTDAARAYLQDRFGIAGNATEGQNMRDVGVARSGVLYPHKTTIPNQVIPKQIREDPRATAPPDVIDAELHKGLHHLLVKGVIPPNQDLSDALVGENGPMQTRQADIVDFSAKFKKAPVTTALEDHALASQNRFQMDLMTPVNALPTWEEAEQEEIEEQQDPEEQARAYAELMDQYSLHEFLIRRGTTVDSTPEFLSFHRSYTEHWPPIAELILQLEGICIQYAVPLAIVNGKQLADLSMESMAMGGEPVPMEDLLSCVKNIQQVAAVLQQPGRRYKGPGGSSEAAVKIQSIFRGSQARKELQRLKREAIAAAEIQDAWGRYRQRQRTLALIVEARVERERQFQALQKWLTDYWEAIEGSQHVVVHVPSFTISAHQKMGLNCVQARQNAQMSRMCDVADPLVDVVYVAPYQLSDDVDGYWNKLLEVGGVDDPGGRCRIIYPENYDRLPLSMSLSAQLLSSPRALKRIRAHVKGRPAYIVPGHVGEDEKDLAVALGLPLLAPHPSIVHTLSKKSAARSIFMEATMNVPPGRPFPPMLQKPDSVNVHMPRARGDAVAVVDNAFNAAAITAWVNKGGALTPQERILQELVTVLAELVVTHPMVSRWLMKVDNGFGGRGHCYLELAGIKAIEETMDKLVNMATARQGNAKGTFDALDVDMQAMCLQTIKDSLRRALPSKAVICCMHTHPTWGDYLMALGERGGVIEACPDQVTGSPSANVFIDPTGQCTVLSTQEQIFCPAYRYIGASFPQSSVPHAALCDAAIAIGEACYQAGIIGHIGLDFVAHREDGLLRLWAVDLNICCTSTLANFQLFDFLSAGESDLRQGSYYVPDEEMSEDHQDPTGESFQRRCFTTVDFLSHRGLNNMQYSAFFNKCRLNGLAFDMQDRLGTVFNLMDSFASGVLGFISVGRSSYEAFAELAEVMQFMSNELGPKGMMADDDDQGFKNVHATFKYLAERLRPAANMEGYRHH